MHLLLEEGSDQLVFVPSAAEHTTAVGMALQAAMDLGAAVPLLSRHADLEVCQPQCTYQNQRRTMTLDALPLT